MQFGDKQGVVYQQSEEAEAFMRWSRREFLEVERDTRSDGVATLPAVDFKAMVTSTFPKKSVRGVLPQSLADARKSPIPS